MGKKILTIAGQVAIVVAGVVIASYAVEAINKMRVKAPTPAATE